MKKILMVMLVAFLLLVGIALNAKGEEAPAMEMGLTKVKTFTAEGQLDGTWILTFEKDDDGYYRCGFDMGDGRVILVPLTEGEVDKLMVKAVDEIRDKVESEQTDDRTFLAKAADWIVFWD
jgi:hypothetical protein